VSFFLIADITAIHKGKPFPAQDGWWSVHYPQEVISSSWRLSDGGKFCPSCSSRCIKQVTYIIKVMICWIPLLGARSVSGSVGVSIVAQAYTGLRTHWCCQMPLSYIHPSGRPSIDPSNHPSIHPASHPSVRPSIHSSIRPFVRQSVCLSVCLSISHEIKSVVLNALIFQYS
jgi:hypothetical protein